MALICLFLVGLYTNYTIQVSAKVPFPSAPSGVAGMILLWRRRNLIAPAHFACLVSLLLLYLISMFCATNSNFLPRRTNGLIQLSYSIIIGYALFLTVTQASRRQIAGLFLSISLVIMVGCLLEAGPGHVFSTAIVTEQASVLPRCRHCRAMLAERGPQPVVGEDGLDACLSAIACSPSLRMSMTATLTVGTRGHEIPRPAGSRAGLWWTRWRRGGQSVAAVASSLMAVRAEDSSTMVLPAA